MGKMSWFEKLMDNLWVFWNCRVMGRHYFDNSPWNECHICGKPKDGE